VERNEACSQDPANGSRSSLKSFSHRTQETLSIPSLSDCPFSIGRSLTSVKMIRREEVLMFKVGEKVVYPAHGVGEIEAIRTHVISGTERKFYMLRILETDMKIMIPIDNVDSVGLRKVIDRAMVSKVYKVLRQKKVETDQQTWNRRYREYTEKIKTGSILEIATVLRDLFVLKGDKELSFGERKMLDTARNLLVKELSIARSHSEEKIMEELRHIFTH
jgi:CarD family transcriptional regulator